ncbi:MAG: phenylacetate--CoA ligase family protein [Actinomycetota bacterium]|nr:phenylacetate--CoA ligase family protein [Actinomycetota bacterium]
MTLHAPDVETRDAAEQRARDGAALRLQLAYLRERSAFYRDRLAGAGDVGLDDLPGLPFTTKDEIRESLAAEPPLGRHLAAPHEAVRRVYSTSGTTGDPSYVAVTDADLAGWVEIGARSYAACGIAPGQRAVLTYNSGPFVAGAVLDSWTRIRANVIPVGSGNTERLVKAFQLLGAEALGCTPSYAIYLADWCRARDIDPLGLGVRLLAVAGEPGGGEPATREQIEQSFGATVREAMGIADVSPSLWGECEEQAGMHFCGNDYVHAELIDPAGDAPLPWEDGAEGELVYSSLRREAMPVLRFRSRDRVVVTARPCACGRTSVRVRCIGRTDDLLIVRGTNLFPTALREVVAEFRPRVGGPVLIRPAHTGVRQDVPPRVLVELAEGAGETDDEELSAAIQQAIRAKLVTSTAVELVPYGTLPRSEYKSRLVDFSESATR